MKAQDVLPELGITFKRSGSSIAMGEMQRVVTVSGDVMLNQDGTIAERRLYKDANGDLHNPNGPAFYDYDGSQEYYVHGKKLSKVDYERVRSETLPEILEKIKNTSRGAVTVFAREREYFFRIMRIKNAKKAEDLLHDAFYAQSEEIRELARWRGDQIVNGRPATKKTINGGATQTTRVKAGNKLRAAKRNPKKTHRSSNRPTTKKTR